MNTYVKGKIISKIYFLWLARFFPWHLHLGSSCDSCRTHCFWKFQSGTGSFFVNLCKGGSKLSRKKKKIALWGLKLRRCREKVWWPQSQPHNLTVNKNTINANPALPSSIARLQGTQSPKSIPTLQTRTTTQLCLSFCYNPPMRIAHFINCWEFANRSRSVAKSARLFYRTHYLSCNVHEVMGKQRVQSPIQAILWRFSRWNP